MDRYIVIGNPVAHSLSPRIHAAFARATGEPIEYTPLEVPPGKFAEHAARFFDEGGRGANVTLPFKQDAFAWAAQRSVRAQTAGASNCLAMHEGRVLADNTDGAGLVVDLVENLRLTLRDRRVLILGAGGATRGVLAPLLALGPGEVVIANRTLERAQELCARFASLGTLRAVALDALRAERYDLVINATSSGTRGEAMTLPAGLFTARTFAYDMAYGAGARVFLAQARAGGAPSSDGLGMLVEQAAESFLLWRGKRPSTQSILRELRAEAR